MDGKVDSTPVLDFDFQTPDSIKLEDIGVSDGPRSALDGQNGDVTTFFARPQIIQQYTWNLGEGYNSFNESLPVWAAWRNLPVITNRLTNLSLLKGSLEVRVMMTGNLTYAGAMQASYLRYKQINAYLNNASTAADIGAMSILSQQNESHQFNVCNPQDFVFTIPIPTNLDYMDITGEYETDGTGYFFNQYGDLLLRPINTLLTSSDSTAPINITVFARLVDYELSIPTTISAANLTPQSGDGDEVEKVVNGKISSRATALARRLSNFNNIPTIGPWTRATSLALQGAGTLAALMGYSRPDTENAPVMYKDVQMSNLASTTTPRACRVLSVDHKQQLTIGPEVMESSNRDPLVLDSIARNKSYVTSFDWNVGGIPNTMLHNFRVTPMNFIDNADGSKQLSAAAAAFLPYTYWRGTVVYEIQVVKNKFHMGKFAVCYDPRYFAQETDATAAIRAPTSLASSRIYNVSEIDRIRVVIHHGQPVGFLETTSPGLFNESDIHRATKFNSVNAQQFNGTLGIYHVTDLTSASDSVPVRFNVYSYALDCQAAQPDDQFGFYSYHTQDGIKYANYEPLNGTETDGITDVFEVNKRSDNPHLTDMYFGESIRSLRPLSKRFITHRAIRAGFNQGPDDFGFLRISVPMYGNTRGAIAGEIGMCNNTVAKYLSMMFAAYRGSMIWQFVRLAGQRLPYESLQITYGKQDGVTSFIERQPLTAVTNDDIAKLAMSTSLIRSIEPGYGGKDMVTDGVLENRIPHLTNLRAIIEKPIELQNSGAGQGVTPVDFTVLSAHDRDNIFLLNASAGEDFQVWNFVGCPPMYFHIVPPL